ncbi:MAG: hypothetical protein C0501_26415 [Isosphaera sp.]|nr:hypothetical protein [Isosphaera sp.]
MFPPIVLDFLGRLVARAADGLGPRPHPPSYRLHPVHPDRLAEFLAAHPDGRCAEAVSRALRRRGLHAFADALDRDVRPLKAEHPGCLVAVTAA